MPVLLVVYPLFLKEAPYFFFYLFVSVKKQIEKKQVASFCYKKDTYKSPFLCSFKKKKYKRPFICVNQKTTVM